MEYVRNFRDRFGLPISDDEIEEIPYYRPSEDSPEMKYLKNRRQELGGFVPSRKPDRRAAGRSGTQTTKLSRARESSQEATVTPAQRQEASVRSSEVLCDTRVSKNVSSQLFQTKLEPSEWKTCSRWSASTAAKGSCTNQSTATSVQYYKEAKDGQLLEEGINEAGAMGSFIAAGSAYSNLGMNMIPFYVFYSMFGFQRVGDLIWCAADTRCKGFLVGGTSGRTTLNGEGLQHEDGHSQLIATTVPSLRAYDPAYGYELAVIIQDGLRRMYGEGEEIFYYLSVYNDNHAHPAMPEAEGTADGIINGMYQVSSTDSSEGQLHRPQLFGSGPILQSALAAQTLLAEKYGIGCDVWSVTSYSELRRNAMECQHWNDLHPGETPKVSYLESVLEGVTGPFISTSDNVRLVADQIREWIPGEYIVLGTDGFGRSETREELRRHFRIDAESTAFAALQGMVRMGAFDAGQLPEALQQLDLDPDAIFPSGRVD